jgi:glycosyltransferase involved in cell wall biosynthesis
MTDETKPEISIVLPIYKNRLVLRELCSRLCTTLAASERSFEIICVNDACPEGSLKVLMEIACQDDRVVVLALEQNVGQHRALLAGMARSRAAIVILMDADLQDRPEAIPTLIEKLDEGYGAVYAGRRGCYQSKARLFSSRLFKGLVAILTGMPSDAGLFVALSRQAVQRVLDFDDEERPYLTAMIACVGLPVTSVPVLRAVRPAGVSAYSSWMRMKIGLHAVLQALRWRYLKAPRFQRRWRDDYESG